MNPFLRDAEQLLDAACAAPERDSFRAVCIGRQFGIRIIESPRGWSLAALAAHTGASAAYLVEVRDGAVQVEGWCPTQRVVLSAPATSCGKDRCADPAILLKRPLSAGPEFVTFHDYGCLRAVTADHTSGDVQFQAADPLEQVRPIDVEFYRSPGYGRRRSVEHDASPAEIAGHTRPAA